MPNLLELGKDALKEMMLTNEWPEDISLEGIESHALAEFFLKNRHSPRVVARKLLDLYFKENPVPKPPKPPRIEIRKYEPSISEPVRAKTLEIKEQALELKKEKLDSLKDLNKKIDFLLRKIDKLDDKVNAILRKENINV